jgi:plastocyanin
MDRRLFSLLTGGAILLVVAANLGGMGWGPIAPPDLQAGGEITLVAQEYGFWSNGVLNPTLRVKVGEQVRIRFYNMGHEVHDLVIIRGEELAAGHGEEDGDHELVLAHSSHLPHMGYEVLVFTPTEPGTYTYYCSVEDHAARGMMGTLIVEE